MTNTVTLQSGIVVSIETLVTTSRAALLDGELTFGEVVQLAGQLANTVNQRVQFSGAEMQTLVLTAIETALECVLKEKLSTLSEDERASFESKVRSAVEFAKATLPSVLTLAADAANGKLSLVPKKESLIQILLRVLRCITTQVPGLPTVVTEVAKEIVPSPGEAQTNNTAPVETSSAEPATQTDTATKSEESQPNTASQ